MVRGKTHGSSGIFRPAPGRKAETDCPAGASEELRGRENRRAAIGARGTRGARSLLKQPLVRGVQHLRMRGPRNPALRGARGGTVRRKPAFFRGLRGTQGCARTGCLFLERNPEGRFVLDGLAIETGRRMADRGLWRRLHGRAVSAICPISVPCPVRGVFGTGERLRPCRLCPRGLAHADRGGSLFPGRVGQQDGGLFRRKTALGLGQDRTRISPRQRSPGGLPGEKGTRWG